MKLISSPSNIPIKITILRKYKTKEEVYNTITCPTCLRDSVSLVVEHEQFIRLPTKCRDIDMMCKMLCSSGLSQNAKSSLKVEGDYTKHIVQQGFIKKSAYSNRNRIPKTLTLGFQTHQFIATFPVKSKEA